ncbi:MAG: HAD family hydrolase [Methanotrichaceae archaeon]
MLKIISFDMDGTLVCSRYVKQVWLEAMPQLYANQHGMDFETAKKYAYDEYMSVGCDCLEWYDLQHWFDYFDIHETRINFLNRYKDLIEVYPEVDEVLKMLSEKYELVVTSNGATEFIDMELDNIRHYFIKTFSTTSDFKKVKNCPEVYQDLCRHLNARPKEVLHIGDHYCFDYEIPLEAGLKALYLDREGMMTGPDVVNNLKEAAEIILRL